MIRSTSSGVSPACASAVLAGSGRPRNRARPPRWRKYSAKPRIAVTGVRSSWLASATKRRIRSSLWCAAASDSSWAWNAVSIWLSIVFSDRPRLPISVRGSRSGTRRFRCPAAISPAVASMSTSGRRLARTTTTMASARMHTTMRPMISTVAARLPIVALMLPRSAPTIRVPETCVPVGSW